jgi:hypothetical protein
MAAVVFVSGGGLAAKMAGPIPIQSAWYRHAGKKTLFSRISRRKIKQNLSWRNLCE